MTTKQAFREVPSAGMFFDASVELDGTVCLTSTSMRVVLVLVSLMPKVTLAAPCRRASRCPGVMSEIDIFLCFFNG